MRAGVGMLGVLSVLAVSCSAEPAGDGGLDAATTPGTAADGPSGAVVDAAIATNADAASADLGRADLALSGSGDLKPSIDLSSGLANAPDLAVPPNPGPQAMVELLGGGQGLGAAIIDASPDEAGNLWAVSSDALYIRRAGQTQFRRYTNADGLHIDSVILAVAGGGDGNAMRGNAGDGYVGLMGIETGNENDAPAIREPGKAEHVTLHSDGTITSLHYADLHNDNADNFWITRSGYRLLYVHEGAPAGHLFMGGNHGIDHIFEDRWGDHVHVEVTYEPAGYGTYGLWYGLAIDPTTGGLWTCGKNACGLQQWNPDPHSWTLGSYLYAFTVYTGDHGLVVPNGYREDFVGTAVTPDGTAYFLSKTNGLSAYRPRGYDYQNIHSVPVPGLGFPVDVAADGAGIVYIADTDKVLRLDPQTNSVSSLNLPISDLRRLYLDRHATPRALYVSSGSGVLIYRGP